MSENKLLDVYRILDKEDVLFTTRDLSKLKKIADFSLKEKEDVALMIKSLSDFELTPFYAFLKERLSIYPSKSLCIDFLSSNLVVAKYMLTDVEKNKQDKEFILNSFLRYVGVREFPCAGATRIEYDLFYDDLLSKAHENLGFSLSVY